jgi:hypothetical protein
MQQVNQIILNFNLTITTINRSLNFVSIFIAIRKITIITIINQIIGQCYFKSWLKG